MVKIIIDKGTKIHNAPEGMKGKQLIVSEDIVLESPHIDWDDLRDTDNLDGLVEWVPIIILKCDRCGTEGSLIDVADMRFCEDCYGKIRKKVVYEINSKLTTTDCDEV